jgi:splicing factor 3B subunit 2
LVSNSNETPALFQVLAEKRVDRVGGAMMASTHVYDVAGATAATRRPDTVELALDPSELDLVDTEAMAQRYEQTLRQQQSQLQKEDLSDMLAEHVARQKVGTTTTVVIVVHSVCCITYKVIKLTFHGFC